MSSRKRLPPKVDEAGIDHRAALAQYQRRASIYDAELALFEPARRRAIAALAAQPGERIFDVGCGTGLSLPLLRQGVGAGGQIFGIEQSPPMMAQARERVAAHGWQNVTLQCAPVEAAEISGLADAALFHFTHDILRSRAALANVMQHLKPGARIVASGLKWAPWWALPANLFVLPAALHSVTSLEGMEAPWSRLAEFVGRLQVDEMLFGALYVARGVKRP